MLNRDQYLRGRVVQDCAQKGGEQSTIHQGPRESSHVGPKPFFPHPLRQTLKLVSTGGCLLDTMPLQCGRHSPVISRFLPSLLSLPFAPAQCPAHSPASPCCHCEPEAFRCLPALLTPVHLPTLLHLRLPESKVKSQESTRKAIMLTVRNKLVMTRSACVCQDPTGKQALQRARRRRVFPEDTAHRGKPLKPSNVGCEGAERKSVTGAPREPKLCVW